MSLLALASAQNAPNSVDGADRPATLPRTQPLVPVRDEVRDAVMPTAFDSVALPGFDRPTPIHTQQDDPVGGAYGIWAVGTKYKVSFHGGMTFVPYLGSDYPHNQPFAWRTTSVRHGQTELLRAGEQPAHAHDDLQYRYRFGGFTEVYDVRSEGLAQSFVIARPAAGGGDLVVEGSLATKLVGEPVHERHAAIRFFDAEDRHILTYGEAYAIDAAGRKTNLVTTLDGNRIRLRVDAAWLADASWPVTIDPILTPTQVVFGTLRESTDICRDDTANDRMVVYIRTVSATDKDVFARILEDNFSTNTTVFNDVTTSWSHRQVRVAAADSPQKYLVAFDRDFTAGTSAIRGHLHDSGDLTLSTTVTFFTWTSSIQDTLPDIGGTLLSTLGDTMMLVYQRDVGTSYANTANTQIWASTIDITGTTPVQGTPFQLNRWSNNSTDMDMERPSVNQQAAGGSTITWMVVWQEYWNDRPTPPDDWDTCGRLVDSTGNQSSAAWVTLAESSQTNHQLGPVVAGASGRYCVTYAYGDLTLINFKTGVINGTSVQSERVNWPSLASTPTRFPSATHWGPHNDRRWRVGGIAYDSDSDSHWALTSLSDTVYSGTGNVYIDRVGFNGEGLESATLFAAGTNFNGDPGSVVFDDDNDEMVAVWIQNDTTATPTTAGTAHEVYATSFTYPTATATTFGGTSCSSGTVSWSSNYAPTAQQIGSEFTRVSISGMPTGALNFIGVSLGTSNVVVINPAIAPGCRLLINNTSALLGFFPLIIGSSGSAGLPLPEFLPNGTTLHFQNWYIDPSTNMVYSTARLSVPLVK